MKKTKCDKCVFSIKHNCYKTETQCYECERYKGQMRCECDTIESKENCPYFKPILKVGTKFKGKINNELFEIVNEYTKDKKVYFWVNHIKSGKVYEFEKKHLEMLLLEIIESEENNDGENES